jgi:Phosphoesterase family
MGVGMDGFARTATICLTAAGNPRCAPNPHTPIEAMGYHDQREIPNYWAYAKNFVLQDHMFEPTTSWSLPAHLYLVSEWSALCTAPGDPLSCRTDITGPAFPPDFGPPPHPPPNYAWTDLTWLLHRHNVSWGYYVKKGPEPDCENSNAYCGYKDQQPQTPGIWNPLPYFTDVHQDHQLGDIRDTCAFPGAGQEGDAPGGLLGDSQRLGQRASQLADQCRPGLCDEPDQHDRPWSRLEQHGDLPRLG